MSNETTTATAARPSVRDEIDAIVAAWRRDGGVFAKRTTLVERFKEWAERREKDRRTAAPFESVATPYSFAIAERRRCSSIVTAVAREMDEETARRLTSLRPGEEADNGVAVGAFRAAREIYARINGLEIDPATGKPVGPAAESPPLNQSHTEPIA